jgi:N,N-dimethylformamidase beta subunit-like, C-terminal
VGVIVSVLLLASPTAGGGARQRLLLSGFGARSYRPGQVAVLRTQATQARRMLLQVFLAGGVETPGVSAADWDRRIFGEPMTAPQALERKHGGGPWIIHIRLGAAWPTGDYVARLRWLGQTDYAPLVLRPLRRGGRPVLVVEPTNTWQAYNVTGGDSWYLNPAVHTIDLTRPYAGVDVRGRRDVTGLPPQFFLDLGFLRWYWRSGFEADFVSDDDLERVPTARALRDYRLIVFAGHEEYVTAHVYDLMEHYRDGGGNLAFLSANNFFYAVRAYRNRIVGRTPWRNLGRPEAALVGAQYAGWNEARFPNRNYQVTNTHAAPWLFAGTRLRDGSRFGRYGIEIDRRATVSPPDARAVAVISHEFGTDSSAEMTVYRRGRATVFDAGALNFGASAYWPGVSQLVSNLWQHLSGEQPTQPARRDGEGQAQRRHRM